MSIVFATDFIRGTATLPKLKAGFLLDGGGSVLNGSYNDLRGHSKTVYRSGFCYTVIQKPEQLADLGTIDLKAKNGVIFTYNASDEDLALAATVSSFAVVIPDGNTITAVVRYTRPVSGVPQQWRDLAISVDNALVRYVEPNNANHCDRTRAFYEKAPAAQPVAQPVVSIAADEVENVTDTGAE